MSAPLDAQLRSGLVKLKLDLDAQQVERLLTYQGLIAKWNKVYNLTAVRDPQDMLHHHLFDSLAVVLPLRRVLAQMAARDTETGKALGAQPGQQQQTGQGEREPPAPRLLDVGSGAGLPGVVLAICLPELEVSCVDTVGKKAAFIQQVAAALQLPNLKAIHARVETLTSGDWDIVSSRAFASLVDFTSWSRAALAPQGLWLAMKGKHPADELAQLPADLAVFHVEQLQVPGLDAERCLLWLHRAGKLKAA